MANKSCSYYEILGLSKNCSLQDIKQAYKQLARIWHPDKNPAGSEHIKLINKAYEVLSDPETRVQYDRSGFHTAKRGGQTFSNISDEGDRALWTLRDVEERHCGDTEYMSVLATVLHIRENCMYKACPTENCREKVNDTIYDGHYCVKCERAFNSYKWRFLLSVKVADWTGSRWVSVFHDEAVDLLGVAPEQVALEGDLNRVLAKVAFKEFIFRLRIKTEMYKGEVRQRLSVVSVKTPDVKKHCYKLI